MFLVLPRYRFALIGGLKKIICGISSRGIFRAVQLTPRNQIIFT